MKNKKILLILSFLLVALMCIASVAASEDNCDDNLTSDSSSMELEVSDESDLNELSISNDDSALSSPQTIVVDKSGGNHNEMNEHTIRNAIQSANDGDTIIINGADYVHCHIQVDKKLTIKSNVGSRLSSCSSTAFSGHQGMLYLTSKASGTIIEGFNFNNDDGVLYDSEGYAILIDGASDVIIRNCTFSNDGYGDAIRVENAKNILIQNVIISNANYGIKVVNSAKTTIESSNISNNKIAGVAIEGNSKNSKIIYCNVTHNGVGFNLTSSNYVYILSNYIAYNNHGVYVNCNVTKIEIKGNFFNQNKMYEVLNDHRVRNLISADKKTGYKNLEIVDNNYMIGLTGSDAERPVYRIIYDYKGAGKGDYIYDSGNDVFKYVGDSKGDYTDNKGAVFLGYVFEINKNVNCPVIFFDYGSTQWSSSGNYELQLSEITQVKKGVYSISIVDENGNIAKDISSVPITFYLNKQDNKASPQDGDIYKTVMMKNGTATVRFYKDDFKESGNVITAVSPTPGSNIDDKVSKTFAVVDAYIPGTPVNTTLTVSNLKTYPKSNQYLTATLKDNLGNPISGEPVVFKISTNTYTVKTDENGQAKQKVYLTKEGTYTAKVSYAGDDVDYLKSSAQAQITVKKTAAKIVSSNLYMIPKMAEYYSITLKDASGKPISSQKVTFKVNGKTYTKKTNSKGVAKVKLKFNKNKKTYKITIKFAGTKKYKAVSKNNKIYVKYSSKTAKLTVPSVTIPPKTSKYFTVTLKDAKGKAIKKQKVTIKVNGKTYTKKTNSKGKVSIKVKFSKLKNYKVSATYKGSKIYKKASSAGKIKVAKTATKITAPKISATPKESKTYTVTLKTSAGKAVPKQKVTIKVNGKTYTKKTNSKGQASIKVSFANEKSYPVTVNFKGTAIYKASKATGKVTVSKIKTQLEMYNRTFSKDASIDYQITLKDKSGNVLKNQKIKYSINNVDFTQLTDANGKVRLDFTNLNGNSFDLVARYGGSNKYSPVTEKAKVTIADKTGITFIDSDLPNSEIQKILDNAPKGSDVEFLGDYYFGIALDINKSLNIYSNDKTILNAKDNNPTLTIKANKVNITNLIVVGNSGDSIAINDANDIVIYNNSISNSLDESKIESYVDGSLMIPGYGVSISNSNNVKLMNNYIESFESGLFAEYSSDISIDNNTFRENNYGIKYGFGVANTEIINNEIVDCIGLYIMTIPEGPTGYGIYLNNSAVNVTVNRNHIYNNFIGISLDANYSTGIVITQNTITDQILEGIRFNAGYDLAKNAVEPIVTDNAIYRNARGPSMMILGEMSANPFGIYGNGLYDASDKLQLNPNWYGTNQIVTWDNDTGVVGYGTMCPRINTSEIKFNEITYDDRSYKVVFYKNSVQASNLPEFDLFATLNWGTNKATEVNFNVVNGVGSFSFNSSDYNAKSNTISITVASLIDSTSRVPNIIYSYDVPKSEI